MADSEKSSCVSEPALSAAMPIESGNTAQCAYKSHLRAARVKPACVYLFHIDFDSFSGDEFRYRVVISDFDLGESNSP